VMATGVPTVNRCSSLVDVRGTISAQSS